MTTRPWAIPGQVAKKNFLIVKELLSCERSPGETASLQRSRGTAKLNDDGLPDDRLEILAQAYHPRVHAISWTHVDE